MNVGRILLLSFFLAFTGVASLRAEVVVIVHPSHPILFLSRTDIQKIYLLKKIRWKDEKVIVPINLPMGHPLRGDFSRRFLSRDQDEMESYYLMRALSGKGQPPIVVRSSKEVKELITREKYAIGYIDEKDVDASVKVIRIDGRGPER